MGMFNDNVGAGRTGWTYTYTGEQLLAPAIRLYNEYRSKEEKARNHMADYMKDMTIPNNDRRVEEVKRDIVAFGTLKEQCDVFRHEFKRNPNKEYELGLGDVTFFGLADG
jgi:predicted Zn-dependent protease